jgi:Protein of unknown function (DUF732)
MKVKKAITGSLLGLAIGVGVVTTSTGTAQADPGSYVGDLAQAGFTGPTAAALDLGYAVCDRVAAGYTQAELIEFVWNNTGDSVDRAEAKFIVESAEMFLC